MIKKKILLIVGILFLFSIPSIISYNNSLNSINQSKSSKIKITNYISQLKYSGYAINHVWNSTKTGTVKGLAISGTGNYIAVGHNENISLFNNDASNFKKPIWTINTTYNIVDVDISGDGTYIAAIYAGNLSLFDNSPSSFKKPIWTFNTSHSVTDVAISLDGIYIALGSWYSTSGYVWLFNTTNFKGKEMWKASTCQTSKTLVDISYNGEYIAVASDYLVTGPANFYLFNKSYPQYNIPMWKYTIVMNFKSLAISNNGEFVVAAAYYAPNSLLILFNKTFSIGAKKEVWSYTASGSNAINDVAISYNGDSITAGNDVGYVYLFNNTPSSTVQPIWTHQQSVYLKVRSVSISGDGQYIVVGFEFISTPFGEYTIILYNSTKTTPKSFEWGDEKTNNINNVEISLDGRFFVSNKVVGSNFNITLYHHNIPIPTIIFSLIGDDDDSNEDAVEPIQIPFGNYFLIFTVIALISLIVIMKRKII